MEYKISKFDLLIKGGNKPIEEVLEKCYEKEQILNKKIKEMNKEIIKLKEEQNKVNKIKIEYEKCMNKLNNDIYQFSQKKEEFEKFRKNELIKIKNNKKNIISESKIIKEIKNKNQELINKSKKDKEIIDKLTQQVNKLQIRQKEKNLNMSAIKERKYKSPDNKINLSGSKSNLMNRLNTQYKTHTHKLSENKNNNNLLCHSIDDKKLKEKINVSMKRNKTSNNKNHNILSKSLIPKENEIIIDPYNKTSIQNESSVNLSLSQKILETSNNNIKNKKENKNERLLFSPIACKTSIGFGLRKISIKLNNSPKLNSRLERKIYENNYENQVINTNIEEKEENKKNNNCAMNNIFSTENKKKYNIRLRKQKKSKKEMLNNSENNAKNRIKKNISKKKNNKEEYDFVIPKKYLNKEYKLIKTIKGNDKIINMYSNDKKEIVFNNGIKKEIYKNEHQIIYFTNGDMKQIFSDGKISYFYNDSKNVETILNNGTKIYKLKNGQIEKHFPDGTKLIIFKDDTEKYIYNDGSEETYFSEGFVNKDKDKEIIFEKTLEEDN